MIPPTTLDYHPLLAAFAYLVLLLAALIWRERHKPWLLLFYTFSIFWALALFFDFAAIQINLAALLLLLATTTLGMATAVYQQVDQEKHWLSAGIIIILLTTAANFILAQQSEAFFAGALSSAQAGKLIFVTGWAILNGALLITTWQHYRQESSPWHANRLLVWWLALFFIIMGEAAIFTGNALLIIIGQISRLFGAALCLYAFTSRQLVDIRTRLRNLLAFLLTAAISALPVFLAILLIPVFMSTLTRGAAILFGWLVLIISLGLFLSFRHLVSRFINKYLFGQRVNTNRVVSYYNELIASTLEVDQLARVIIGTFENLWQVKRGALLLSHATKNAVVLQPIPGLGIVQRDEQRISSQSKIMQTWMNESRPLLRYEIYADLLDDLPPSTQAWLDNLNMEVWAPIQNGQTLAGIIVVGPKASGEIFRNDELELMQLLARQTAIVLQNARLYSELEVQNEKIRELNLSLVNQNERLEVIDQVKTDFITVASHELRTPLTQVKGYADLLATLNTDGALTQQETNEIMGYIDRATIQMEQVIGAMLDASQLDVDGVQINLTTADWPTLLETAVEQFRFALRERQIKLTLLDLDALPAIQVDFQRMTQALTNIIGNAIKFTPDRGTITIFGTIVNGATGETNFVELVIADTGIGVDPQYHALVFDKFFRIGSPELHSTGSTKFKGGGTGLGLHIAKGVVEAHNGRIWLESPGADEQSLPGSEFHILLPLDPAKATA